MNNQNTRGLMPDFSIETRMFVSEVGTLAVDGFAGFRLGQAYELNLARWPGGIVVLELPPRLGPVEVLIVKQAEYERWWKRIPAPVKK